jgi:hypothetical protein
MSRQSTAPPRRVLSLVEEIRLAEDDFEGPAPPCVRTEAPPGTEEKLKVFEQRYADRQDLFHVWDRSYLDNKAEGIGLMEIDPGRYQGWRYPQRRQDGIAVARLRLMRRTHEGLTPAA